MARGTVKWFNNAKGFGFLNSDEYPGKDIFVHYSSIQMEGYKTIAANQVVDFDVEKKPNGELYAPRVVPVSVGAGVAVTIEPA